MLQLPLKIEMMKSCPYSEWLYCDGSATPNCPVYASCCCFTVCAVLFFRVSLFSVPESRFLIFCTCTLYLFFVLFSDYQVLFCCSLSRHLLIVSMLWSVHRRVKSTGLIVLTCASAMDLRVLCYAVKLMWCPCFSTLPHNYIVCYSINLTW
jgi:hypothetical protein